MQPILFEGNDWQLTPPRLRRAGRGRMAEGAEYKLFYLNRQ